MELYQRETAKIVREAGSWLSALSDRALVAFWGIYSCETHNRFWAACDGGEVLDFLKWANHNRVVKREVEKAKREILIRKEERAAVRQARPRARFIMAWDNRRLADPRIYSGDVRATDKRQAAHEPLMTVHELADSTNRWCAEQGIAPTSPGSKRVVDEQMVRYCCKYSLLDRPGSPSDGRRRGFSQKHACQMRVIRLLQARSLPMADINTILHGRSMPELLGIEHEELCVLKGLPLSDTDVEPRPRSGSPRWA